MLVHQQIFCNGMRCVVGVYCGYANSICSEMILCCVWSLLCLQQHQIWCNVTVLCLEIFVVGANVVILQYYCFYGVCFGYSNSRYSAKFLCFVWRLLWLHLQKLYCNGMCGVWRLLWQQHQQKQWNVSVLCLENIVVTATDHIVQYSCVLRGVYCVYSNSRYNAMLLCYVWSLMWFQLQQVY